MVKVYCIFLLFIHFNVGLDVISQVNREGLTQYPFNALVFSSEMHEDKPWNQGGLGCSGVIIRGDLVLTPASCLYVLKKIKGASAKSLKWYKNSPVYRSYFDNKYGKPARAFVDRMEHVMLDVNKLKVHYGINLLLGDVNPAKGLYPLGVKKVHVHEKYQHGMPYFDVAVLQLERRMILTSFNTPIKLSTNLDFYADNKYGVLTGLDQKKYNATLVYRHFQSVRMIISPPGSCDQESNKDSTQRKSMRKMYHNSQPNERAILCATVREGDEGMCQGWHVGSAFTVGEGYDRRLVGIASSPNICPNSGAVIITSLQATSNIDLINIQY